VENGNVTRDIINGKLEDDLDDTGWEEVASTHPWSNIEFTYDGFDGFG
jgi:hypothetical protein